MFKVCLSAHLSTICLFVHPSVPQSLSFLQVESLVFSDIVHDASWPLYLVTDKARVLKKILFVAWTWAQQA